MEQALEYYRNRFVELRVRPPRGRKQVGRVAKTREQYPAKLILRTVANAGPSVGNPILDRARVPASPEIHEDRDLISGIRTHPAMLTLLF